MRHWIAPTAALAMAACSRAPAPLEAPPPDAFAWRAGQGADGAATLAYVRPDGALAGLKLSCTPASGRITFAAAVNDPTGADHAPGSRWLHTLMLRSGGQALPYPADAVAGPTDSMATGLAQPDDTVFTAFAQSGELSVDGDPKPAETPAEQQAVADFVARCAEPK